MLTVIGLVAGFIALAAVKNGLRRDLVVADPDEIPSSRSLFPFAVSEGRPAYLRHCAGCHGAGGRGDRAKGAPSLADNDWLYGSGRVSEIEWTITHGIRAADPRTRNLAVMPAFATPRPSPLGNIPPLTPGDIHDVVEFLVAVGSRDADPAAATRGSGIFHGRGGCYDCHGADARGDPAIGAPRLVGANWLTGDGERNSIFASIARGRRGVCPAWGEVLGAVEVRALAVYVYSLSHDSGAPR
jgi:cytochrome c oxidase cbb3-type subunit 3